MAVFGGTELILAVMAALAIILVLGGGPAVSRVLVRRQAQRPARPAERPTDPTLRTKLAAGYRLAFWILGALAILTGVEFWVALNLQSVALLVLIGLFKAALIVEYFMHLSHVWSEEED